MYPVLQRDSCGALVTEIDGNITQIGAVSFGAAAGCVSWGSLTAAPESSATILDWIQTNSDIQIPSCELQRT
jgi:hypothetical protein